MMPHLPRCGIIVNVWTFGFLLVLELSEVAHLLPFSLTPALSHGERESMPSPIEHGRRQGGFGSFFRAASHTEKQGHPSRRP